MKGHFLQLPYCGEKYLTYLCQVLGLGQTRIVSINAGTNHTLAISELGDLWACGRNRMGQLGNGTFRGCAFIHMRARIEVRPMSSGRTCPGMTESTVWRWPILFSLGSGKFMHAALEPQTDLCMACNAGFPLHTLSKVDSPLSVRVVAFVVVAAAEASDVSLQRRAHRVSVCRETSQYCPL